jgi:hypothetical protein
MPGTARNLPRPSGPSDDYRQQNMPRSPPALVSAARRLLPVVTLICAPGAAVFAQTDPPSATSNEDVQRAVKRFDFDERRRGNYEDTPMHWRRLTGDGLPSYSTAAFDERQGHAAPPSFAFHLRGGNIAYEYMHSDLSLAPNSDYVIEGYIRVERLEYAAALLACYVVDVHGQRVPGSERVSRPVRTVGAGVEWQRVELALHVESASACALRMQLWVLQDYVWQPPSEGEVDPIVRQDVEAWVWFDDLAVIRQPRARLSFSNPAGLVKPGAAEALQLDVHNSTPVPLTVEVSLHDLAGASHYADRLELLPQELLQRAVPVPALSPGLYEAALRVSGLDSTPESGGVMLLADRAVRFAVLPELPPGPERAREFGVDLGPWAGGDPNGAAELVRTLACGAVKIGLPMLGRPGADDELTYFQRARELARNLALTQVETTGVILPPADAVGTAGRPSLRRMLVSDAAWSDEAGPVLAYFGGHVAAWQLGCEADELRQPVSWNEAALRAVQRRLERFVALPRLIIPRSVLDAGSIAALLTEDATATGDDGAELDAAPASCYWLPADLPTPAIPWQVAFWDDATEGDPRSAERQPERWLSVGFDPTRLSPHDRLADLARRVVLAALANADRLFVPAPFELVTTGGHASWQPTLEYIPLRTLWRFLAGSRAVAAPSLPLDSVALLFRRADQDTMVAWTWRETGVELELLLGARAAAFDLHGVPQPLALDGPRARVRLTPAPLIVQNVNAPLLQLPDNFRIEPLFIQVHDAGERPTLMLSNPYPGGLAGTIELHPPAGWHVAPAEIRIELGPGETLTQPLDFTVPPRQTATAQKLGVELHLRHPDAVVVHLDVAVQVGLRDIVVEAAVRWDGDALVIEQSLRNLTSAVVSFNGFCQPPQRPQMEGVFLNVRPNETRTRAYRVSAARDLAGGMLWIGVREIGGARSQDQILTVPG